MKKPDFLTRPELYTRTPSTSYDPVDYADPIDAPPPSFFSWKDVAITAALFALILAVVLGVA